MLQPDRGSMSAITTPVQQALPDASGEGSMVLPDGRRLSYCTYGVRQGDPVYFFHGFPGSRIQAALVADLVRKNNLYLVAADRPGFGKSEPADNRTILSYADDVRRLADHLGHDRFGVIGVSCGGPYAMACAYRLGGRVSHIGLMAGIGPLDMPGINAQRSVVLKIMFALARVNSKLVIPLLLTDSIIFRLNPEKAVAVLSKMLTLPDQVFLRDNPGMAQRFGNSLAEAYRQGIKGPLREVYLIASPREFHMQDIKQPADVYQGAYDRHVPPAVGRYIAETLPNADYHFYENEGHMSILVNAFSDYVKHFGQSHNKEIEIGS